MKSYSVRKAVKALSRNPCTALIVDRAGSIVALIRSEEPPSPQLVWDINEKYPNTVCRLLARGTYTAEDVEGILKSILETFELRDQGLLGRGMTTI
jgi:hypothetical protein